MNTLLTLNVCVEISLYCTKSNCKWLSCSNFNVFFFCFLLIGCGSHFKLCRLQKWFCCKCTPQIVFAGLGLQVLKDYQQAWIANLWQNFTESFKSRKCPAGLLASFTTVNQHFCTITNFRKVILLSHHISLTWIVNHTACHLLNKSNK